MASKVSGMIEKLTIGSTTHAIASTAYGYCETSAATPIKDVDMTGFVLYEGVTVHIKFANINSADNPKLRINSSEAADAKPIVQYGTTAAGKTSETNGWYAGAVVSFTYDGTSWVRDQGFNTNSWRGIENSLTSDSTTVSLSAAQGKVLKGLIDAMDATTPAASGNATAFIDSLTQTDGKITSITKKNLPTASTSTAGIIKIGTTANDAAAGNHTHGNIQNTGTLQTTDVTIGSGDKLVITDSSDSNKVARSSLAFSAAISSQTTSSKFLREDGTWSAPSYITNTDTKVTQTINTVTTGTDLYPLLFSYYKTTESTTTEQTVQRDTEIYAQPSIGAIGASKYVVNGKVVLEYNSTDQSLDFTFI